MPPGWESGTHLHPPPLADRQQPMDQRDDEAESGDHHQDHQGDAEDNAPDILLKKLKLPSFNQ
jgi:hypothetical protein